MAAPISLYKAPAENRILVREAYVLHGARIRYQSLLEYYI